MPAELFTLHTHYDNLKVSRDAPPEVIRAAYKVLVQRCHPDKWDNAAEATYAMQVLSESYAALMDPQQRREHDAWILREELRQQTWTGAWTTAPAPTPPPHEPAPQPASTQPPDDADEADGAKPAQHKVASLGSTQAVEGSVGAPPLAPEPAAQTQAVVVAAQPGPAQTTDPPAAEPPAAEPPATADPGTSPEPEPEPEPEPRPEPAATPIPPPQAQAFSPCAAARPTLSQQQTAPLATPGAPAAPIPPAASPAPLAPAVQPAAPGPQPPPRPMRRRRSGLRPEVLVAVLAAAIVLGAQLFFAPPEPGEAHAPEAPLSSADVHDLTRPVPPQVQAVTYPQVSKAHPDARLIVVSPEFDAWRKQQSAARRAEITRILGQGTPGEVIALLHEYKRQLHDS